MTDIEEALEIIWDRCQHCKDVQEALEILRGERPHGEWIWNTYNRTKRMYCKCSICGIGMGDTEFDFCPNCGADMRRKEGEPD